MPDDCRIAFGNRPLRRVLLILAVTLLAAGTMFNPLPAAAQDPQPQIAWEMKNRMRLFFGRTAGQPSERFFRETLARTLACATVSPVQRKVVCSELRRDPTRPALDRQFTTYTERSPSARAAYPFESDRAIEVSVRNLDTSSRGTQCVWSLNGNRVGGGQCRQTLAINLGQHRLAVRVIGPDLDLRIGEVPLVLEDTLIVVLGDSFMSGEGNPHVTVLRTSDNPDDPDFQGRASRWWDHRCHRSLVASPVQAALRLAADDVQRSVTLLSFACSGAEVAEGVIGQYSGRETPQQVRDMFADFDDALPRPLDPRNPLPSQIDQALRALCQGGIGRTAGDCRGSRRKPDAVIVSVGVNDIKFGSLVTELALSGSIVGEPPSQWQNHVGPQIDKSIVALENGYKNLEQHLAALNPGRVLTIEYPDPTYRPGGGFCFDSPRSGRDFVPTLGVALGFGVRPENAQFASERIVAPLNAQIERLTTARAGLGWRFVGGIMDRSRREKRGYCGEMGQSWFRTYEEAASFQDILSRRAMVSIGANGMPRCGGGPSAARRACTYLAGGAPTGAMHPNELGHAAVAAAIFPVLTKELSELRQERAAQALRSTTRPIIGRTP